MLIQELFSCLHLDCITCIKYKNKNSLSADQGQYTRKPPPSCAGKSKCERAELTTSVHTVSGDCCQRTCSYSWSERENNYLKSCQKTCTHCPGHIIQHHHTPYNVTHTIQRYTHHTTLHTEEQLVTEITLTLLSQHGHGLGHGHNERAGPLPWRRKEMHCRLKLLHLQSADINSSTYF